MRKRPMCLACLGFMLVLVLLRIAGVPPGTPFSDPKYENEAQQGRKVWIAGTIETYEKKSSNNGYVLRGEGSKGKIYLLAKRGDLPVGAAVRVYGTVKKPESPRNPGMFDEKTYYEGKGCAFYVISEREEVVDVGRWNLGEALRLARERCCAVLKEMMPEEEAGVLSAMLLGERSELTEETYLAYQQSGLLHLISVSGMHLMLLGMALRRLLMALHLPIPLSYDIVITLLSLVAGATTLRERWLMPILFFLPIVLLFWWSRRLTDRRLLALAAASILCAVACSAGLFVTTYYPDLAGRRVDGTQPFQQFAAAIEQEIGTPDVIISSGTFVPGNLRLVFPTAHSPAAPFEGGGPRSVLAVWEGDYEASESIRAALAANCGAEAGSATSRQFRGFLQNSETQDYILSYIAFPACVAPAT